MSWTTLDQARAPGGGTMTLHQRGSDYAIRVDGIELMASDLYGSEQVLARLACEAVQGRPDVRILIGGLGMGFTLRACLDALPPGGTVTVAEIVPQVVEWNRGVLGALAGRPLEDPRVTVAVDDVARILRKRPGWDAILLDVDNGPAAVTRDANDDLYDTEGLEWARQALKPGGLLAVWSVLPDAAFEQRLRKAGFRCETRTVPAQQDGTGDARHTIFLARDREGTTSFR